MFTVLATRALPKRSGMMDAEIILAHVPDSPTPYVTWQRNTQDRSRYWGHYFKTESEARNDFNKR